MQRKNGKLTVEYYKMLNKMWVINENIVKKPQKTVINFFRDFRSQIFGKFGD